MKLSFRKVEWPSRVGEEAWKLCESLGGRGGWGPVEDAEVPSVELQCGIPEYSPAAEKKIEEFIKRTSKEIGGILSKEQGVLHLDFHFDRGEMDRIAHRIWNEGKYKGKYLLMEARGRPTFIPPDCEKEYPGLVCYMSWKDPAKRIEEIYKELREKIRRAMS
ncbi:hypothetical protein [Candidatus Methanodesulfokora washburnensis]|uniref:Uncharacterized protein n=1 Tax=Candidatus Methanodesulfokora washburnensis TaxID=2478471 RepID=A0A3R9R5Q3_9CREN|nr:hypothetical protein [Candidatus Methanodesulfokores washburnensis]RSN75421.1 hypothetical protein D6D85_06145 [Candidatus Methanodesulfokores washburnensis]